MKIFSALFLLFLCGCASTPAQKYQREFQEYSDSVWSKTGSTVPKSTYWDESAKIAQKYDRRRELQLFSMMKLEALKKESDGSGQYDYLERKFLSGDAEIFYVAEGYFITLEAQNKCASFGYGIGTGDFNKCVFEVRSKLVERNILIDQLTLQMLTATRPRPLIFPTQTRCTTSGNQTNCTTQ